MQKLSREEVVRLSENMARLSGVKTSMARKVINNFFDEFREQSGINGASRSMLQGILNKALGTEIASSVINGIYGDEIRSRMARLQWVEPRQLAMLISEEHLQLQAVFLAFLTPEISAAVLSYLNESVQNEILYRGAKLNDVNRDVVDELDRLIERGLSVLSERGSKVKGIKQAADIVNRFQGNQQVILDQMRERDEEVLGQIQDEMYDFFILSRQNEEVRRRLLDEVPMEDWAVALKGTEALLRRSIYAVMPKRQAQQLEAITARLGPVPVSRIEQIRREIMGIARELEEAGEIQLQLFAEQTAEYPMTIETLRGRYRLHRFPPRQRAVTGEPLTASISAADYQRQLMDGFQEGLQKGFAQGMTEGQEQGFSEGHQQGFAEGRRQGYTEGSLAGQQEGRKQFVEAAQPLEAITGKVNDFLAHIERKQREDLLQLVEKVTRQVIRCELALQPTQLLALVEEALAAFPAMPETLQVMLSTEEFNRLRDAVPEKVSEWGLTPSPDLPPGECRVITDKSELDIGCEHRLEQCMTALQETLTPESQGE